MPCTLQKGAISTNTHTFVTTVVKCIPHLLDFYSNNQLYCDCQQARDSPTTGIPRVGKYCQYPANQFCPGGGGNGRQDLLFVSMEECVTTTPPPCRCVFVHPTTKDLICEYTMASVAVCTMTCSNGGLCRLGLAYTDLGYHQGFWSTSSNHTIGMYCE